MAVLSKNCTGISSQVLMVVYNAETKVLKVNFIRGTYEYEGVELVTYNNLIKAPSIGKFINTEIKGKFKFRKLE